MDRRQLAAHIAEVACLQGDFTLRSGQTSQHYFDKYQFESIPALLSSVAEGLAELVPEGTEVLAGLELGGVPVATAIGLRMNLPVVFVRKQRKTYGTCRISEGVPVEGRRVCVVEDVITTGGQVAMSVKDLRAEGAIIDAVVCSIFRGEGEPAVEQDPSLTVRSLFTMGELLRV